MHYFRLRGTFPVEVARCSRCGKVKIFNNLPVNPDSKRYIYFSNLVRELNEKGECIENEYCATQNELSSISVQGL